MVERFLISYDTRGEIANPNGDFVHYSDYARLQEQVETLTRKNERLENTLKLHSGDVMSLNNEVELFRSHWNDAEARAEAAEAERDRLRAQLEGRDKFIVDQCLWAAFVASLPAAFQKEPQP